MHSHVHCSIILNSHDMETNCLHQLVSGLKKEYMRTHTHTHTHTHTQSGILFNHIKEDIIVICYIMDRF